MSKAEEKSKFRYVTFAEECAFIDGYEQAEEDNELTWEDIKVIEKLLGFDNIIESPKEFYQEVLKRFKDFKERKEK